MYLGDTAIAGTLFSANIFFYNLSGNYFASTDINKNALLHLWSLSVEEQFYLIIPLLCATIWKIRRRMVAPTLALLALLSLAASIYAVTTGKQNGAFYLLHFRAWELLSGALLAMLPSLSQTNTEHTENTYHHNSQLAIVGLLLVLIPYIVFSSKTPFPGAAALPLVVGTALLIRYGQYGLVNKLLCWWPFIFIGQISYSLYLWHWPVTIFWKYIVYDQLNIWDYVGMFVLSLLLSVLSWKFVELPIRLSKTWKPRHSFAFAAIGIFLLVTISMTCIYSKGWPTLLHPGANAVSGISEFPSRISRFFFVVEKRIIVTISGRTVPDPFLFWWGLDGNYSLGVPGRNPEVFLIGDSQAGMLQYGMDIFLRNAERSGFAINRNGKIMFNLRSLECKQALSALSKQPQVTRVILAQDWLSDLHRPTSKNAPSTEELLEQFANHIHSMHKTLFIVAEVPQRDYSPSDIAARIMIIRPRYLKADWEDGRLNETVFERKSRTTNERLIDICRKTGAVFIPLYLALKQDNYYIAFVQRSGKKIPLYRDTGHLNREGSLLAANFLMSYLFPIPVK